MGRREEYWRLREADSHDRSRPVLRRTRGRHHADDRQSAVLLSFDQVEEPGPDCIEPHHAVRQWPERAAHIDVDFDGPGRSVYRLSAGNRRGAASSRLVTLARLLRIAWCRLHV